jgi:putative acetyltransferase
MEAGMKIREELETDRRAIHDVVAAAFAEGPEADLVDDLRAECDEVISLVAEDEDGIVGHVLFSPMEAPFRALGLAPVAVVPERQGEGIGSALIRAGLDQARRAGWQAVFVLGEPGYYQRFGFDPALARGFACAYAGPYLMALPLEETLPATGHVEYAEAFGRLALS